MAWRIIFAPVVLPVRPACFQIVLFLTIAFAMQSCALCAEEEQPNSFETPAAAVESSPSEQTPEPQQAPEPKAMAPIADSEQTSIPNSTLQSMPPALTPASPDVFMLPDKDGKLRMVLGFNYEDFLNSRQQNSEVLKPPAFSYKSLTIAGELTEQQAKLQLNLSVETQSEPWVEVPLQMPGLIIQEYKIENPSKGECVVFDAERQSYYLWLKGKSEKARTLTLTGIVPVVSNGETSVLTLNTPRIPGTKFTIRTPVADTQFKTPSGMELTSNTTDEAGTQLELQGSTSQLQLEWQLPKKIVANTSRIIESTGNQVIHIGRHVIRYEADLELKRYGAPLERCRVLLPSNSKLVRDANTQNYNIKIVKSDTNDDRQLVEINCTKSDASTLSIHLVAEQLIEENISGTRALDGFEVLDSFRQSGAIDLRVDNPLQAFFDLWGKIDQIPLRDQSGDLTNTKAIGRFSYAGVPWKLTTHIIPGQRRTSVQPSYEMTVDSDEARLDLNLDYQFSGARTYFLRIDMHGWELTDDPIESAGVVNQDLYTITQSGLLNLPLHNAELSTATIKFVAKKPIQVGSNEIQLPEPLGVFVADGSLTLRSDPSLQILPRLDDSTGLSRASSPAKPRSVKAQSRSASAEVLASKNGLDEITFRTFQAAPKLIADMDLREQELSCDLVSQVYVGNTQCSVQQQLIYDVKYQASSQLMLQVPTELWQNETFEIYFEDESIPFGLEITGINNTESSLPNEKTKRIIVALPRPVLGKFIIVAAYSVPLPEISNTDATALKLPIAKPVSAISYHQVELSGAKDLEFVLDNSLSPNIPDGNANPSDSANTIQFASNIQELSLLIRRVNIGDAPRTQLERAWLQSWIIGNQLQTRGAYRCFNSSDYAYINIPALPSNTAIEILLNGSPSNYEIVDDHRLKVAVPAILQNQWLTLEIRYLQKVTTPSFGNLKLQLPELESLSADCPFYWQVVLPPTIHALNEPMNFTSEYWLGWNNNRWGRHPHYTQKDLEALTNASSQPEPSEGMNQYLFQTFQQVEQSEVRLISRFLLVTVSSCAVFAIGMIGIYTSLFTRKEFWLAAAISLLIIYFVYPEASELAIQALFWGGITSLFAVILKRQFLGTQESLVLTPEQFAASTAITQSWKSPQEENSEPEETTASIPVSGT